MLKHYPDHKIDLKDLLYKYSYTNRGWLPEEVDFCKGMIDGINEVIDLLSNETETYWKNLKNELCDELKNGHHLSKNRRYQAGRIKGIVQMSDDLLIEGIIKKPSDLDDLRHQLCFLSEKVTGVASGLANQSAH